jgi:hypothetical protein
MAYFPHAYQKMMVASAATPFLTGSGSNNTLNLAKGQVGVVDPKTNNLVALSAGSLYAGGLKMIYLAQGSFYETDKLGSSLHGGYQETVKSKGINPKYVSAFYLTKPANPVAHVVMVKPTTNCDSIACDTTYRLRVDVKGSPALRFLTHNLYQTVDAYSGCCDASDNTIDPMVLLLQWKERINESLILNQFVNAQVFNVVSNAGTTTGVNAISTTTTTATFDLTSYTNIETDQYVTGTDIPVGSVVTAINGTTSLTITFPEQASAPAVADFNGMTGLKFYSPVDTAFADYAPVTGPTNPDTNDCFLVLTGTYMDTTFGDCSFSPKDHVEYQPIEIYTSVVEQTNVPCDTACFGKGGVITAPETSVITAGGAYVLQQAKQGKGFGETVIREYILDKEYRQEPWKQDPRMREVLGNTTLGDINRGVNSKYAAFHILHSVPRNSNPSGTMDNDQYLVKIVFPLTPGASLPASATAFKTFMNDYLADAGNPIVCVDEFGATV